MDRLKVALADRYSIEGELGSGGMATVYLARDVRHHRKVAVKVLRPELAVSLGSERFSREIDVAARLQHPHILPLLDSGEVAGFYFYVMPYVAGEEGTSLPVTVEPYGGRCAHHAAAGPLTAGLAPLRPAGALIGLGVGAISEW